MEKKRVIPVIEKYTNYIFHMLAVARVGYDSEYSIKYRSMHSREDLQTLRKYNNYITVKGGEYCGELYGVLIINGCNYSRNSRESFETYYNYIIDLINYDIDIIEKKYGDFIINVLEIPVLKVRNFLESSKEHFINYSEPITRISKIFLKNIDIYEKKIWSKEEKVNEKAAKLLTKKLKSLSLIEKWEEALELEYNYNEYELVLCSSIANGPQAIDLAGNRNLFYAGTDIDLLLQLISHEIGIFIFMPHVEMSMENYEVFESLIGFYNIRILGETPWWHGTQRYIDFYNRCYNQDKKITLFKLYEKGLEFKLAN